MALKLAAPFPLFSPAPLPSRRGGAATELHFSRWNNANAEPFLRRQREQQAIEADIRLHRRHLSASRLAEIAKEPPLPPAPDFKSLGTPSAPSPPSIPGKASKYSNPPKKPPQKPKNSSRNPPPQSHPAFRRVRKAKIIPAPEGESGISVSEKGVSYKIEGAPFEFQYSYTEAPRVKPVALREPPFLPFGPGTTPRPWTGRAPLPASKKKLPEFDSFKLPPPGKKGVKPVQAPGPFLARSGPRYKAASREEILGEPLTEEEVKDLVQGCLKTRRQLNMGRDGLTHNMLDNIHAHWKRRRVCKIKCKGVCTVDMDNVCQQLEEKTGGKIIYSRGGVIFLFRGRNYNYKTRPRFPLMLWRPVTPVYPRLIQRVPEGLTLQEVTEMRKRGRQLPPICKLAKNGLYSNLVKHVREAFEACELVRVNCQDFNKSDCRKIGAKLKDLVPCILISFEYEHILLWRGKDWKSSLLPPEDDLNKVAESAAVASATISSTTDSPLIHKEEPELESVKSEIDMVDLEMTVVGNDNLIAPDLCAEKISIEHVDCERHIDSMIVLDDVITEIDKNLSKLEPIKMSDDATASLAINQLLETPESGARKILNEDSCFDIPSQSTLQNDVAESGELEDLSPAREAQLLASSSIGSNIIVTDRAVARIDGIGSTNVLEMLPKEGLGCQACLDGVMFLLMQAVENGSAVILDNESLDADMVFDRSVALAKTAPPQPIFQHKVRKVQVKNTRKKNAEKEMDEEHKENDVNLDLASISDVSEKRLNEKRKSKGRKREDFRGSFSDIVPHGSLRVDELAKLLA